MSDTFRISNEWETILSDVHELCTELYGDCVIAGGAVRDAVLDMWPPKDFDIYVYKDSTKITYVPPNSVCVDNNCNDIGQYNGFLRCQFLYYDIPIQILHAPNIDNPYKLFNGFDYTICNFSYDRDNKIISAVPLDHLCEKANLELQHVSNPYMSLRRGFKFSERYGLRMTESVILELTKQMEKESEDCGF